MDVALVLGAGLLYPGLLTALVAGLLYRMVLRGTLGLTGLSALGSREGLASFAGVLLAGVGLALLPWPLHLAGGVAGWLVAWVAFELAFLLPLLPALATGMPPLVRAAVREAQLGTLARAIMWAALVSALSLHGRWDNVALMTHLLALAAALAAFPVAIGWGPFGPEERLTPDGITAGLDAAGQALDNLVRDLRAGILLAAVLVAVLPLGILPAPIGLPLVVSGVVIGALLLRNFAGRLPRMTLPDGLRFCLVWPVPLMVAATIVLGFVR